MNSTVATVADVDLYQGSAGWTMHGSFGEIPLPVQHQPDPSKYWRVDISEAQSEWVTHFFGFESEHHRSKLEARFLRPSTAPLTPDQLWMCDRAAEYLRHYGHTVMADRLQSRQWLIQSDRLRLSRANFMHGLRLLVVALLIIATARTLWLSKHEVTLRRIARGVCPRCTYPLLPDTGSVCPECGLVSPATPPG